METPKPHAGGRPTKYDPIFVQKVDEYISKVNKEKKRLIGVEDFANYLGVDDTTILNWANRKLKDEKGNVTKKHVRPEFFAAIKRLKHLQKAQLMQDGLYGGKEVNSTMAIFLLKVNHGMIETSQIDHTTKGKELPTPILGGVSNVHSDDSNK